MRIFTKSFLAVALSIVCVGGQNLLVLVRGIGLQVLLL